MEKRIKAALKKLIGTDDKLFDSIVAAVDDVNRSAAGMINREREQQPQEPAASAPASAPAQPVQPKAKAVKPATAAQSPVARELSDDELDALLSSDKFAARIGELISQAIEARSNETEEDETKEAGTPESEPAAVTEPESNRAILDALTKLTERVDDLSKTRDAEVQEVLNDLPARIAKTTIVRPRATRMPADVNSRQARTNMAEVAAQTLAAMGETG